MITEDYVSFEVAKLLKEKGFNEPCRAVYEEKILRINTVCDYLNSELSSYLCAPTLQMAMKWLREVHNIMVAPYALSLGYYFEIFDLTTRDITSCKPLYKLGIPSKECVFSTYEEAVEAAIKYCLENLIKIDCEKKIEQRSTWSKEDERLCECLINDQKENLDEIYNNKCGHSEIISDLKDMYHERIDWLRSLKDRLQHQTNCV